MIPLIIYIAIFAVAYFLFTKVLTRSKNTGYVSRKTVTFGDESAVRPNRAAGLISVLTVF